MHWYLEVNINVFPYHTPTKCEKISIFLKFSFWHYFSFFFLLLIVLLHAIYAKVENKITFHLIYKTIV